MLAFIVMQILATALRLLALPHLVTGALLASLFASAALIVLQSLVR